MFPMDWGPVYRLGRVVLSPSARAKASDDEVAAALLRHSRVAWGTRPVRPHQCGPRLDGCRVLSAYRAGSGALLLIITEANRHLTRVFLPEDC
jgi:hypothetical protein